MQPANQAKRGARRGRRRTGAAAPERRTARGRQHADASAAPRAARPARPRPGEARAELFAAEALTHLGQMYPAALRVTGDPSDAEELVIQTYARAYQTLGERGDCSTTAWLYRNMADAAEETWLAGRGVPESGPARGDAAAPAGQPRLDGVPAGQTPRLDGKPRLDDVPGAEVRKAMQRVPGWSRLALYLADVEGFSTARIARILRLPADRVTSRLRRGRRQLRAALQGYA